MSNDAQPALGTVLELARQNVLEESQADTKELQEKRQRQLEALQKVTEAREEAEDVLDWMAEPPEEQGLDPSSFEFEVAQVEYDKNRSAAEEQFYDIFSSLI